MTYILNREEVIILSETINYMQQQISSILTRIKQDIHYFCSVTHFVKTIVGAEERYSEENCRSSYLLQPKGKRVCEVKVYINLYNFM